MKDTPETDAHSPASYAIIRPDGVRTDYVPADFARKLERERDKAQATVAMLHGHASILAEERNEARGMLERTWHEDGAPLLQMMRERDEAREAFSLATNQAIAAREMLRRIMNWSPCLPDYERDAEHFKFQSDTFAARKFLEGTLPTEH